MASSNGGSDFLSNEFLSFFLANRYHVKKTRKAIPKTHKIIFPHGSGTFFTGKKGLILYIGCAKVSTSTLCTRTSKLEIGRASCRVRGKVSVIAVSVHEI